MTNDANNLRLGAAGPGLPGSAPADVPGNPPPPDCSPAGQPSGGPHLTADGVRRAVVRLEKAVWALRRAPACGPVDYATGEVNAAIGALEYMTRDRR